MTKSVDTILTNSVDKIPAKSVDRITAKSIVHKAKKPAMWFGAEYNMNIYRGCTHGCIYCDSRSDCYRNPDFDKVKAKEKALELIRNDLRRKTRSGVIATGSMSDPYNPIEKGSLLTRNALELINAFGFGVAIATKSTLVTRDIDILQDIKAHSPVIVKITITSVNDGECGLIEPGAPVASERFSSLKALSDAGIFCGVLMMPILPFINDTETNIRGLLTRAKESGAKFVYPSFGMTLRSGNREYYYSRLDALFPGLKEKYIKKYGDRYQCSSPKARALWDVFKGECGSLGLLHEMQGITHRYKLGYEGIQLSLFD
ncbi:MAG: radical SAM protein [Oscillospiraceae bacterium]|nr:radical SAM protein [Oscillospiraceae bacterium]